MWGSLRWLIALSFLACIAPDAPAQLIRTAPDLKPPPGYVPGTGVDRNGIKSYPSTSRNRNVVLPGGGYYYGWWPGSSYYYSQRYYYPSYALCPYCGGRWCNGRCYNRGPIYLPPIAGDAGLLYGPRAAQEFLGVGNNNRGSVSKANDALARASRAPIAGAIVNGAPQLPPPVSNPTARAQAWKFVEYGDRHFKKGNYRQAVERYKKAQGQASDVAEIYFRLAFAELGLGQYSDAVQAMRQGLAINPTWPESGFVLEELYPTADAKRAVFRQLVAHRDEHPHDAEALFLLSVIQHFDGQQAAAEVGFHRVVELTGVAPHASAFLPPPKVAEQPPPAPENGGRDQQR